MSESEFDARVRLALHEAYHPCGTFWNNKTGWSNNGLVQNHDPFPGRGGGDLIGCVMGLWIEVENKAKTGKLRELQKVHRELVTKCGGLYVECRELGFNFAGDFDQGFERVLIRIDIYIRDMFGLEVLDRIVAARKARKARKAK